MELSQHFTYEEAVLSQTASRNHISNTPSQDVIDTMVRTAACMEEVRSLLGTPITISSWYRSKELNAMIGGVPNSQHLTGEAVDFIAPAFGTPLAICKRLISSLSFDQLILEHTWVHISFASAIPSAKNRNQVLSLLSSGHYSSGLTDKNGVPL